jgi:hypothetical protein
MERVLVVKSLATQDLSQGHIVLAQFTSKDESLSSNGGITGVYCVLCMYICTGSDHKVYIKKGLLIPSWGESECRWLPEKGAEIR